MGGDLKTSEYDRLAAGGDDGRVVEWEIGLPSAEDLTPLWQPLITPELASAFSISPEPSRSIIEVQRASRDTVSSLLRRQESSHVSSSSTASLNTFFFTSQSMEEEEEEEGATTEPDSYSRKVRWESDESIIAMEEEDSNDAAPSLKRHRLVCMPQLHKRFVDVVAHLGVKNAVPQTIMQLMNVEGLTRENVAGHLQKYRLYLERQQKQQGVQFK